MGSFRAGTHRKWHFFVLAYFFVLSGAGAAKLGGRFVSVCMKALYVSDSEETLLQEIAVRKRRLGEQPQGAYCVSTVDRTVVIDDELP